MSVTSAGASDGGGRSAGGGSTAGDQFTVSGKLRQVASSIFLYRSTPDRAVLHKPGII